MKKGFCLLILFTVILICGGCGSTSFDESGNSDILSDSLKNIELLDYLEMSQNEAVKTLDLISLDENTESLNVLEEETYRGTYNTANFYMFFNQGEMKDIWLSAKTGGASGICSLAGCDMTLSREEAERIYQKDCQYVGANNSMYISSLRLEKMGVLEMTLACIGSGDLNFIAAEVSAEKAEILEDLEYVWSDREISLSNSANNVEIDIQIPQISIPTDPVLSEKLNRIFEEGLDSKLNQYGWDMSNIEEWEDVRVHIDYEKTFESAEYISIHYTGSIITDERGYYLDFGTTVHTSAGGGMLELSSIFNDKIFNQYENGRTRYDVFPDNEEALQDFNAKEHHYLDYYLLPSCLVLLGDVESGNSITNMKVSAWEYDTVSLLRNSISWVWDIYSFSNKDSNVNITICAPQIEVCLQEDLKRTINGQIGEIIFDEIQNYGLNVDELEEYENVRVLVNGDCVFFSEDYQRFLLECEMDSGEEKQKWQFEITVCLEENHEMVSVEK